MKDNTCCFNGKEDIRKMFEGMVHCLSHASDLFNSCGSGKTTDAEKAKCFGSMTQENIKDLCGTFREYMKEHPQACADGSIRDLFKAVCSQGKKSE